MKYSWAAFSGGGAIILAAGLAIVVAVLVIVAVRLRRTFAGPSVSPGATALMVVIWLLTIVTFLLGTVVYGLQAHEVHFTLPSPANHVTPVTLVAAGLSFVVVLVVTPARPWKRIVNALFCACVGPMIFELPFDLIVMSRTSAIPPAPVLYVALYFLPLLLVELVTITLAVTRSGARITRWTFAALAAMFGVFAIWALIGFHYPSGGLPLALNIVSKILAFVVALTLFTRREYFEALRQRG